MGLVVRLLVSVEFAGEIAGMQWFRISRSR